MKIVGEEDQEESRIEIIKLSASSMKTFDQCPKKYYYNYIAREPRKEWAHFKLGNFCHKVLENFHNIHLKRPDIPLAKLMSMAFTEARKDEEFQDMPEKMLVEAKELIKDYLVFVSSNGMPNVKGVEKKFNIKITDDILIRGFLDRVDLDEDGQYHIVDYKTTKNVQYLDPFQLLIYGIWLKDQYKDIDRFKGSYVLLRHKSAPKPYEFNLEDLEECKKKIIGFASKIRTCGEEDKWTPLPSRLCQWCDFMNICPTQSW